jgi:hypothetical protein
MTENFEYKGQWFLPINKEKKVSGILRYDVNHGITLEVLEDFEGTQSLSPMYNITEYDIILGVTSQSKEITLYKTYISQRESIRWVRNHEVGKQTCKYSVQYIFEGVHFDKVEDINFDTLISEFVYLDEWVGIFGFTFPNGIIEGTNKNNEWQQVNYKLPEPIVFPLSDDLDGHFNFVMNTSAHPKKVTMEQKVQFVLKYKNEKTFKEIWHDLNKFQNFLILCLNEKTNPRNILLHNGKIAIDYGYGMVIDGQIKLYYRTPDIKSEIPLNSMSILFRYREIQNNFAQMIKTWFERYEKLESVINLLINHFFNDDRFSENIFLNLVQAAESFHARTRDKTKMHKAEYKQLTEQILSKEDEKYHKCLKELFHFGNKLNLHTRLNELIASCSCKMIDNLINDKDKFIRDIKNSRNYYTHYSPELENKALKNVELFPISEKLKLLMICIFLLEVGLDKNALNQILERKKYTFLHL